MKTFKTIFLLVLAASIFAACSPELDKLLVKQDGVWNVDKATSEQYTNGTLDTTEVTENDGTITFNDDNTGSYASSTGETGDFTWSYNADLEVLTWTQDSISLTYDVIESSKNAQTLRNEFSFEFFGQSFKTITTIELGR